MIYAGKGNLQEFDGEDVAGAAVLLDFDGSDNWLHALRLGASAILFVAPELWYFLPVVFVVMLFLGWIRIKSGSILGSWLVHASANVTMALIVAVRTVPVI